MVTTGRLPNKCIPSKNWFMLSGRLYNVAGAHSECYAHGLVVFFDLHITDTRMTLERLGGFKIGNLRTTTKFTTATSVD